MDSSQLTLSEIRIYPIKSLSGISLKEVRLTERGLQWDRRWMLLNEEGQFMTQRTIPSMALIDASLHRQYLEVRHRTKSLDPLRLSLKAEFPAEVVEAPIWDDTSEALVMSEEVNEWFSEALDQKCRLVFMPDDASRTTTGKTSGRIQKVSFADAYPILMIGQASLDDLNSRLAEPVTITRFRPNLVFTGGKPFEEDGWHAFTVGNTRFWAEKPCSRCVLITIDPQTASKGKEPLATLAKYRNKDGKVMFGQNLMYEPGGSIRVGDQIEVMSRKEAPFGR